MMDDITCCFSGVDCDSGVSGNQAKPDAGPFSEMIVGKMLFGIVSGG